VVLAELYYGAFKSQRRNTNLQLIANLRDKFFSHHFDAAAARHFGMVRTELERQGTPIDPYDLQIAAIALANDLTLITHNTREFGRVPDLRYQDWEI
jgi:tRNA(fMet)-specific endonuclease VapC